MATARSYSSLNDFVQNGLVIHLTLPTDGDTKCPCCHDPYSGDVTEAIVKTTCGHMFHLKCLFSWLRVQHSNSCPMCRFTFFPSYIGIQPSRGLRQVTDPLGETFQEESFSAPHRPRPTPQLVSEEESIEPLYSILASYRAAREALESNRPQPRELWFAPATPRQSHFLTTPPRRLATIDVSDLPLPPRPGYSGHRAEQDSTAIIATQQGAASQQSSSRVQDRIDQMEAEIPEERRTRRHVHNEFPNIRMPAQLHGQGQGHEALTTQEHARPYSADHRAQNIGILGEINRLQNEIELRRRSIEVLVDARIATNNTLNQEIVELQALGASAHREAISMRREQIIDQTQETSDSTTILEASINEMNAQIRRLQLILQAGVQE